MAGASYNALVLGVKPSLNIFKSTGSDLSKVASEAGAKPMLYKGFASKLKSCVLAVSANCFKKPL